MNTIKRRIISCITAAAFAVSISACGTILYPERKGQAAGQIDPKVAVLNGIGLLLYLVPGVIAFAVDFNNGAIYLPGGSSGSVSKGESGQLLVVKPGQDIDQAYLEELLSNRTGQKVRLENKNVHSQILLSLDEMSGLVRNL